MLRKVNLTLRPQSRDRAASARLQADIKPHMPPSHDFMSNLEILNQITAIRNHGSYAGIKQAR